MSIVRGCRAGRRSRVPDDRAVLSQPASLSKSPQVMCIPFCPVASPVILALETQLCTATCNAVKALLDARECED